MYERVEVGDIFILEHEEKTFIGYIALIHQDKYNKPHPIYKIDWYPYAPHPVGLSLYSREGVRSLLEKGAILQKKISHD